MRNKFLWTQACRIDSTLQGQNWPERMTPAQISRLHFHVHDDKRRDLLKLLNEEANFGDLEFDDIVASYSWNYGSVSIGFAACSSFADDTIRKMFRESREIELLKAHQPACGWGTLLAGIKPDEIKRLEQHLCGCEALCTVEKVYHNGLPKSWQIKGVHQDGLKIDFSYTAEPLITAGQYRNFYPAYGIPSIPEDSALKGWLPREPTIESQQKQIINPELKITQEDRDRETVKAIAVELLQQFPCEEFPLLTTRTAKKHPKLSHFYEKYPGNDPVKPDMWLIDAGIPKSRTGAMSRGEKEFINILCSSQ
ncbi:MAG: hypothetical protein ACXW1U_16950 [Methylobacter sp.]